MLEVAAASTLLGSAASARVRVARSAIPTALAKASVGKIETGRIGSMAASTWSCNPTMSPLLSHSTPGFGATVIVKKYGLHNARGDWNPASEKQNPPKGGAALSRPP